MIMILRNAQRGMRDYGWLKTRHSFSFGDYYNPQFMGYKNLRVINEDIVSPKSGFPKHNHANMEIITYLVKGSLTHEDTLGHKKVIQSGDVQYIRAGHGISHSEYNDSSQESTHFLQIWLLPNKRDTPPTYSQISINSESMLNRLQLIAINTHEAPNAKIDTSAVIQFNSDARIYTSILNQNHELTYTPAPHHSIWVQIISGKLLINDHQLEQGDAIAFEAVEQISIHAILDAHFLLFDLGAPLT